MKTRITALALTTLLAAPSVATASINLNTVERLGRAKAKKACLMMEAGGQGRRFCVRGSWFAHGARDEQKNSRGFAFASFALVEANGTCPVYSARIPYRLTADGVVVQSGTYHWFPGFIG